MKVTRVRAALAICLVAGAAAAAVAFLTSAKTDTSLPVGRGVHRVMIAWVADGTGARFHGSLENVRIEGDSVQPQPFVETFVASGTVGDQRFKATCSGSLVDNHPSFNVTGTMGTEALHGTARLILKSNGGGILSFNGTVGGTTISGTIPLPANTDGSVMGTVSVG
jgi:hypothetical protein